MRFNKPGDRISLIAGATISRYRILKYSAQSTVIQAAAASDSLLGVSGAGDGADPSMVVSGARVDVILSGQAFVEYGGNVTRGAVLTADSIGRAVAASSGNRVIGIALESGVSGDVGSVDLTAKGIY